MNGHEHETGAQRRVRGRARRAGDKAPTTKWYSMLIALPLCALAFQVERPAGENTLPFDEARIYIEFNSTGNDLGFHTFLDAEDWERLEISKPDGTTVFQVKGKGAFGNLGMTELFFEGAEPSLEDVRLETLLAQFPEGDYRFLGRTVEGDVLDSTWTFSHLYPTPPVINAPFEDEVVDPNNLVVDWDPVTTPSGVEILEYEIIIGALDPVMKSSLRVPPFNSSLTIPSEMLMPGTDYELEVIAVEANRNQTITTSTFSTP